MRARTVVVAAAVGIASVASACQPANSFTQAASMHAPRWAHTATLLTSGRVLVVGLDEAGGPTVDRWDPATDRWLARAEPTTPRVLHRATRLSQGKVLVTGGMGANGLYTRSAELYDAPNDRWTAAAEIPFAGDHATALLPGGKVLAAFAGDTSRGWLYDPATDQWRATAPKKTRAFRNITILPGGKALVVGGDHEHATETDEGFTRAEVFDPAAGQWVLTSRVAGLAITHASAVGDGTVLALGVDLLKPNVSTYEGVRVVVYDPTSGMWQPSTYATSCDRDWAEGLTLTGLGDGSALVVGRRRCETTAGEAVAVRVRAGQTTTLLTPAARWRHAAVQLDDGRVLITGGVFEQPCCPSSEVRATAELFTP